MQLNCNLLVYNFLCSEWVFRDVMDEPATTVSCVEVNYVQQKWWCPNYCGTWKPQIRLHTVTYNSSIRTPREKTDRLRSHTHLAFFPLSLNTLTAFLKQGPLVFRRRRKQSAFEKLWVCVFSDNEKRL